MSDQAGTLEEWSRVRDDLAPLVGERAFALFAYRALGAAGATDAATAQRALLAESGTDPDAPQVTETERFLIDWASTAASGGTPDPATDDEFRRRFSPASQTLLSRAAELALALGEAERSSAP